VEKETSVKIAKTDIQKKTMFALIVKLITALNAKITVIAYVNNVTKDFKKMIINNALNVAFKAVKPASIKVNAKLVIHLYSVCMMVKNAFKNVQVNLRNSQVSANLMRIKTL